MEDKKKEKKNKDNKTCYILHTITSTLFFTSALMSLISNGFNASFITSTGLGITFGSLAYSYYRKYKEEKK